jgi:tetratricopeptide (TPR) repeat protein
VAGLVSVYNADAKKRIEEGDLPGARRLLESAIGYRSDTGVMELYCFVLIRLREFATVGELVRGAEVADTTSARLENSAAVAFGELKDFDEALSHIDRAILSEPDHIAFYRNKIGLLAAAGREAEALPVADAAIARFGTNIDLRTTRAALLAVRGEYERALRAIDEIDAKGLTPEEQADVFDCRGYVLNRMLKYSEALEWFERAIAADPTFFKSYSNAALSLGELGRYREAVDMADSALKQAPDGLATRAKNHKGYSLLKLGKLEEGRGLVLAVVKEEPRYGLGHFNLARILASEGSAAEALKELGNAAELDPLMVAPMALLAPEFAQLRTAPEFLRVIKQGQKL